MRLVLPLGPCVPRFDTLPERSLASRDGDEHDFADDRVGPADTSILTLKFLLPLGGK